MITYLRALRGTGDRSLTAIFCLALATSSACTETLSGQSSDDSGTGGDSTSGGNAGDGDGDSDGGTNGDGDGDISGDGDGDMTGDGDGDGDISGDGDGDISGDGDGDGNMSGGSSNSGGSNSQGSGGADGSGGTETEDTEPPSVISTSPDADEDGVAEDAELVIEFSEAMDTAATESAFSSSTLPGTPSFSWGAGDTELTVTLSQPLAYAEGTTAAVTANEYDYTISGATDAAGNPLPELNVSFTTLRRVATTLSGIPLLDGYAQGNDGPSDVYAPDAVAGWYTDAELVAFFTFDTSSLPDNIAEFESATLYAYQTDGYLDRTPYEQFGDLVLQHTTFTNITSEALSSPPLRSLGVFSTDDSVEWHSADVEAAIEEDYTLRVTRQNRSQYWLRFPDGPDGNMDYAATAFYTADDEDYPPRIDVVFLLP